MEKYKDSDVELMSILLKLQEQTSPIRMSIGYTVGGTVRQGIILYEAAPKVIETLIEKGYTCGSTVLSSSFYDTGCDNIQFPLFRLAPNLKVAGLGYNGSRWWYWLSAVVSAAAFARCYYDGNSYCSYAAGDGGVRPYFCIG